MAEQILTFRGITFNDETDPSVGIYMLQNVPEGLRHPDIRQADQPLQNRHGVIDSTSYYGSRTIQLVGKIIADTQAARKILEDNLRAIFALDGVQVGSNPSYYTLYMEDEDGALKQMQVKVSRGVEFRKEALVPNIRDFIVELRAQNPVWLSQSIYTVNVDQGKPTSSLTLPTTLPIVFGSVYINEATVDNDGNFATFPVITITGTGENPSIYNATTNQRITIETTMAAGDELVIDCENGTVTLNGDDALGLLSTSSQFIQLAAGENLIQLSDDSPTSLSLEAQLQYRHAWL
jgi:hypothetical protein